MFSLLDCIEVTRGENDITVIERRPYLLGIASEIGLLRTAMEILYLSYEVAFLSVVKEIDRN